MLMEILIVVAVIALISGGVAVAVVSQLDKARQKTALSEASVIRSAANTALALEGATECPTVAELVELEILDRTARTKDPWGQPYVISCEDGVRVSSAGGDGKLGTEDDIHAPPDKRASRRSQFET